MWYPLRLNGTLISSLGQTYGILQAELEQQFRIIDLTNFNYSLIFDHLSRYYFSAYDNLLIYKDSDDDLAVGYYDSSEIILTNTILITEAIYQIFLQPMGIILIVYNDWCIIYQYNLHSHSLAQLYSFKYSGKLINVVTILDTNHHLHIYSLRCDEQYYIIEYLEYDLNQHQSQPIVVLYKGRSFIHLNINRSATKIILDLASHIYIYDLQQIGFKTLDKTQYHLIANAWTYNDQIKLLEIDQDRMIVAIVLYNTINNKIERRHTLTGRYRLAMSAIRHDVSLEDTQIYHDQCIIQFEQSDQQYFYMIDVTGRLSPIFENRYLQLYQHYSSLNLIYCGSLDRYHLISYNTLSWYHLKYCDNTLVQRIYNNLCIFLMLHRKHEHIVSKLKSYLIDLILDHVQKYLDPI